MFFDHIQKIVSGGQTGADRAALDFAAEVGFEYGGWCPKGGWAEDHETPPGLLEPYPRLKATPSDEPKQRTEWNVRDSDATLIMLYGACITSSPGAELTAEFARRYERPYVVLDLSSDDASVQALRWVEENSISGVLNVAGPRESEAPGLYRASKAFLHALHASKRGL